MVVWPRIELFLANNDVDGLPASAATDELRASSQRWVPSSHAPADLTSRLREIAARIDRAESRLGHTATAQRLRARLRLLSARYDEAIADSRIAVSMGSQDADSLIDLGLAFASRAVAESRSVDFDAALEAFAMAATRSPSSVEAHYDLAWTLEHVPAPHGALAEWKKALALEKDAAWKNEIHRHLEQCEQALSKRAELVSRTVSQAEPSEDVPGSVDLLVQQALTGWLGEPERFSASLHRLAEYLRNAKGDSWFAELLPSDAAIVLSKAARANLDGRSLEAIPAAEEARVAYTRAGNRAGTMAAQLELAYANSRVGRPAQCLEALGHVRDDARRAGYRWLENRAWMEENTCKTQSRTVDVMEERVRAARTIPVAGYLSHSLRARAALAEPFSSYTTPAEAWENAHAALQDYWKSVLPGILASNLYVPLAIASSTAGNSRSAGLLFEESLGALADYPNQRLKAQIWSEWASTRLRAGDPSGAAEAYRKAAALFPFHDESQHAADLADAAAAEADLHSGQREVALRRREQLCARIQFPYSKFGYYERLRLVPALGDSFLASGDLSQAQRHFALITGEARERLRTVRSRLQRQAILREAEAAWRGLTAAQFRSGKPEVAIDSWQTFRCSRDPGFTSRTIPAPGVALLSFAAAGNGVAVWAADSTGITSDWITNAELYPQIERLSALLATRDSGREAIHEVSRGLYRSLIAPVAARMRTARVIVIDADGPLASLAWPVLEDQSGKTLLERYALVQSQGWYEATRRAANARCLLEPALIAADPVLDPASAKRLPRLMDARGEAESIARSLPGATLLSGHMATIENVLDSIERSKLFHFAGHGLANGGFGGLVLAGGNGSLRLLDAQRISGLDLAGLELVVLSACSSGVGELGGTLDLDSLVRAFLEAGAGRVISARWDVDSRATADLMKKFYAELLRGTSAPEALRTAALDVRGRNATSHPYYWAAFQVYGAL
jgi:CHAT domain-containing protein/tetratricopeptide (TPR) repeat protein